ncbi:MAG: cohesin domain-containing protein [Euryarchaeota archaeon]|nr:cohesin domain-containing protein [Euryarchaeota archaeon]
MLEYNTRKTMKSSVLAVLLLICFCQIGLAAGSSVSVSPQTITASPGDTFTIDLIADPADSEVYGAECKVYFDNALLKAIDQSKGTFLSHDGAETIEVSNNINNELGVVEYGETRMGDPAVIGGVTDPGVLASITFEAIGSGACELRLEATLADSGAQPIDAVVSGGTCRIAGTGETSTNTETPASTAHAKQMPEEKGSPGFGGVSLTIGLIAASLLIVKRGIK